MVVVVVDDLELVLDEGKDDFCNCAFVSNGEEGGEIALNTSWSGVTKTERDSGSGPVISSSLQLSLDSAPDRFPVCN